MNFSGFEGYEGVVFELKEQRFWDNQLMKIERYKCTVLKSGDILHFTCNVISRIVFLEFIVKLGQKD